ncbi:MAG TPA: nucleotidyltransferase domain-containing protein [Candidatus Nanoarchaeia archaeon]|nr:nucleotidyltransferase domain-containing protein [Candidatus Nanoarchaeia archaeon]
MDKEKNSKAKGKETEIKKENDGMEEGKIAQEIPEMNRPAAPTDPEKAKQYMEMAQKMPQITDEQRHEMEKTKQKLEDFKKSIIKKYPSTIAIGILPPQSVEAFEEEEEMPDEEKKQKPMHLIIIVPEEKLKEIPKIKLELIKQAKDSKPKLWLHVKTPVDVWNYGLDGKAEMISAIAMAFPLHDKGLIGALRVAEIHKTLVLRKFERYVASYVIAGSLVRGEATKTSDVDVYIVIDDTDVKRMPRLELKEKLRSIIFQYVMEASELAGVRNKLSPQVYLLTDFWESVKDAHPVIFTFIRDGIPLFDKGTFLPWKLLLKMGRIRPSPEAIDMFMSMGDKVGEAVKRRLLDLVVNEIYWSILTPSQALIMLYGLPPPTPKETIPLMREIFLEKEKMLEKKYITILEKIVGLYKDYEHEKLKEIKGEEIDSLLKDVEAYMKRLKELRGQIEKRAQEKTIAQIHKDVFQLLKGIFGEKKDSALINSFESEFIKKGKLPSNYLITLKDIEKASEKFKKGKIARHEVEDARKNASLLINHLIEYNQRCELVSLQKGRMRLKTKDKTYEFVLAGEESFLIDKGKISRIDLEKSKLADSNAGELTKALSEQGKKQDISISGKLFNVLRKELGEFEIIL